LIRSLDVDIVAAREALSLGSPGTVGEEEARTHEAEEAGLAGACLLGNHDTLLALGAVTIVIVVVVDDDLGLLLLLLLILRLLHHHWLGCHHHGLLHHDWLLVNGHHHFLRMLSFKIFI
jgi:hypothetical protein